jgi:putative flippase GtrA
MIRADGVPVLDRPDVRQFVKFCIVGITSFTIDAGISALLIFKFNLWWVLAKTISFTLAVTNGFFWNRLWTFRAVGHRRKREQYAMFFSVNVVGYLLNIGIMKCVFWAMTGELRGQHPTKPQFAIATLLATAVVVFWNFFANRHWTFKPPSA